MRVTKPGHSYRLAHLDGGGEESIQFVDRGHGCDTPGTNNQEVLRALIDRVKFMDKELPWAGNERIIYHLRMALILHEQRHLERLVEKECPIENLATCIDGHVVDKEQTNDR